MTLLVLMPAFAHACSCTNELTLQQEVDNAWVVFAGTVQAIYPAVDAGVPSHVYVEFVPSARWKGGVTSPMQVLTADNEAICGYPFQVGQEYLVIAGIRLVGVTPHPVAYTHLCSRTSLLDGNPYVPQLGPPELPVPVRAATWGTLKSRYR